MNFYIAATLRMLWAPLHELSCSATTWERLLGKLRERGKNGRRESGAFLLGQKWRGRARVLDFILYDDLDPNCLESGIVSFDGRYFGALWDICRERKVTVVADVHTHPYGSQQSESDRGHPMISRAGHLALILPRFAAPPVERPEIGMYRYEGGKRWQVIPADDRKRFLHIGF